VLILKSSSNIMLGLIGETR